MTTREKLEKKLERRREWSAAAAARSEEYNKSEYHASKARGLERALSHNIYSDDSDAIEKLQERIAKLEELQDTFKIVNKVVREKKLTDEEKADKISLLTGAKVENARAWVAGGGVPSYALTNNGAEIRRNRQRLEEIKARAARSAAAENSAGGVLIEYNDTRTFCRVTFAEKPDREILDALKGAGFYWRGGGWRGDAAKLPDCVKAMQEPSAEPNAAPPSDDPAPSNDPAGDVPSPAPGYYRGVLIDPEKKTVTEVQVPTENHDGEVSALHGTRALLGCRVVDCVRDQLRNVPQFAPNGTPVHCLDDIWVDDEGIDNPRGWSLPWLSGIRYGGRGLILGYCETDGASMSSTLQRGGVEFLRNHIRWMNVE